MATVQINHEWGNGASTTIVVAHKVTTVEALSALRIDAARLFLDVVATIDCSSTYVEAGE